VVGVFIGVLTAFIASGYSNIANYLQTLFSFFNVPIFLAFIVGMFWRKVGRGAGFYGMVVGTLVSFMIWLLYKQNVGGILTFRHSDLIETQWGAIVGFSAGLVAMLVATVFMKPKPLSELNGLVYGLEEGKATTPVALWKRPIFLGGLALLGAAGLYVYVGTL
jgi:SSS family solute:Na+ symporter